LVLAAIVSIALLAGCSESPAIKALKRPAAQGDTLPDDVTMSSAGDLEVDEPRLLVEHEGVKYFAARSSNDLGACIAVVPTNRARPWVVGCGSWSTQDEIIKVSGADRGSTMLVRDGVDGERLESEGWTKVHDNVYTAQP
jgi:hypothetical protein